MNEIVLVEQGSLLTIDPSSYRICNRQIITRASSKHKIKWPQILYLKTIKTSFRASTLCNKEPLQYLLQ